MSSTDFKAAWRRMLYNPSDPSQIGFRSDWPANITASGEAAGLPVENLLAFADGGLGSPWRSDSGTSSWAKWEFASAINASWVVAAGLRGLRQPNDDEPTLLLYYGDTDGDLGSWEGPILLDYSKRTGCYYATFDEISKKWWKLLVTYMSGPGSSLGYHQIARVAFDQYATMGTNWKAGTLATETIDHGRVYRTASGRKIHRRGRSQVVQSVGFEYLGHDSSDLANWNDFAAFAGEDREPFGPEMPFFFAANPDASIDGGEVIPPGFWTLDEAPPMAEPEEYPGTFAAALTLEQVI